MNFTQEADRIFLSDENNKTIAEVTFPKVDEHCVDINHTFVDDCLRGQGIAGQLMEALAMQLRQQNKRAVFSCSYAKSWLEKHPEYQDLQR